VLFRLSDYNIRHGTHNTIVMHHPFIQALNYVREQRVGLELFLTIRMCRLTPTTWSGRCAKILALLLDRARRQVRRHHPKLDRNVQAARYRPVYGEYPKAGGVLCGKRLRIFATEARIPEFKDSLKIVIECLYSDLQKQMSALRRRGAKRLCQSTRTRVPRRINNLSLLS
jgi:hypothetical protein